MLFLQMLHDIATSQCSVTFTKACKEKPETEAAGRRESHKAAV